MPEIGLEIVQYIIIRRDLGMSLGKTAAQAAHASVAAANKVRDTAELMYQLWMMVEHGNQKKIVLAVDNEEDMLALADKASIARIPNVLIYDSGATELAPDTLTALGIGPDSRETLYPLVGVLPLLK
jgi:PTH2 family peptidyl-tRNA hydrolase